MIINTYVNKEVWCVYHPRNGFLLQPSKDYIKDIDVNQEAVILQENCSLNDFDNQHWTNDYYGNLVSYKYLYESYEEAATFLLGYYEAELFKTQVRVRQLKAVIEGLLPF